MMIRVGLIGFGLAGRVFHAPLISSVAGLELAAVLERNSDNAAQRYPGITTYRSLEEMLADASLGLFVVATPNGTHFQLAKQILEAGKSVVVDKPTAVTSAEIAQLMELTAPNAHLFPFHNRRWDSDFQTLYKLVREDSVGRIVHLESTFDRWRPVPRAGAWKEDPNNGGLLLDIGTHLADQALCLFGSPEAVSADVTRERDGAEASNDSFTIRMRYEDFSATLSANVLSTLARPRFHLRGTRGNYWKWGLDPQEVALSKITRIDDPAWGHVAPSDWGTLNVDVEGCVVTRPVTPTPGDYRLFYAGVRDALLGRFHAPVPALAAWRVARLLEFAAESAEKRCEVSCDWSGEPDC
jgi:scyllo-inositol 2-dehydrogenase (NADP+)